MNIFKLKNLKWTALKASVHKKFGSTVAQW